VCAVVRLVGTRVGISHGCWRLIRQMEMRLARPLVRRATRLFRRLKSWHVRPNIAGIGAAPGAALGVWVVPRHRSESAAGNV
jgi:hypothetical protein